MDWEQAAQDRFRCRLEWGRDGARRAAARRDMVVVCDTLRFSTAVVAAIARGVVIVPRSEPKGGGTGMAHHPGGGLDSAPRLSPGFYNGIPAGGEVDLLSPNGATCCRLASTAPYVLVGCIVNGRAVAEAAATIAEREQYGISVIACGERRDAGEDGALRFAVEDYLGAGAILSYLSSPASAEARLCAAAFLETQSHLEEILWECASGWELRQKGLGEDVRYAARLNLHDVVPILHGDRIERLD